MHLKINKLLLSQKIGKELINLQRTLWLVSLQKHRKKQTFLQRISNLVLLQRLQILPFSVFYGVYSRYLTHPDETAAENNRSLHPHRSRSSVERHKPSLRLNINYLVYLFRLDSMFLIIMFISIGIVSRKNVKEF